MNKRLANLEPNVAIYRDQSDLDVLLRDYFRSEMPNPWPSVPATKKSTVRQSSREHGWWRRSRSRLALAAAIALFFVSYGALTWVFPNLSSSGDQRIQRPFGKTIDIDRTENGDPVRVEVTRKGKKISIDVQPIKKPSP